MSVAVTPAPGLLPRIRSLAADIKLAHSVFALPFAILAAFLARPAIAPPARFSGQLALVVLCMVFARTWAMLFNRLADRRLDAD
jgi:4-hydroxybenzoate polyprenyltransferase